MFMGWGRVSVCVCVCVWGGVIKEPGSGFAIKIFRMVLEKKNVDHNKAEEKERMKSQEK